MKSRVRVIWPAVAVGTAVGLLLWAVFAFVPDSPSPEAARNEQAIEALREDVDRLERKGSPAATLAPKVKPRSWWRFWMDNRGETALLYTLEA